MRPLAVLLVAAALAADPGPARPSVVQLRVEQVTTDPTLDRWRRAIGAPAPHGAVVATTGTGFLVGDPPVLVTNHHVVAGARRIEVRDADDAVLATLEDPGAVEVADDADVAVVRVPLPGRPGLGLGSTPPDGAPVTLLGFPDDGPLDARAGRRAGQVSRAVPGSPPRPLDLVDVPVTHGMSGGPVLDVRGRVVGVVLAGSTADSDLGGKGLAVPRDALAAALAPRPAPSPTALDVAPDGVVRRADGAAARLGLRAGDRIVAVAGARVDDVAAALAAAGGPVVVEIEGRGRAVAIP